MESGLLEWLVVGIGLNLTTTPADWPEELARTAGSLFPGGPAPVGRAALAGAIARELLALCPAFDCLDEYRSRCFVPGHWVTVCTAAETYAARAIAIDDNAIMVYINRLRSKIEKDRQKPEHIITVRGMGYRFLP